MSTPRPYALVQTQDQWCRCAHDNTSLEPGTWAVQLAWEIESLTDDSPTEAPKPGGLAFDACGRLYHSLPDEGQVERVRYPGTMPQDPFPQSSTPIDLFAPETGPEAGDFSFDNAGSAPLKCPQGLAVTDEGRLFVAETGARRVLEYDLWEWRLVRTVEMAPSGADAPRSMDLATDGRRVYVVADDPPIVAQLRGGASPRLLTLPKGIGSPSRLAINSEGKLFLLVDAGTEEAHIVECGEKGEKLAVGYAMDLEFTEIDLHGAKVEVLVVARGAREYFVCHHIGPERLTYIPQLRAKGYDGQGIVRTPDGRIGFWTTKGFRYAVRSRAQYSTRGRVTTFRLDSGQFQTVWGRVFIDARIPKETEIRAHCVAHDEPPGGDTLERTLPSNSEYLNVDVTRPDLSPPMVPLSLAPGEDDLRQRLHARETGCEQPWVRVTGDQWFKVYECPAMVTGRYLWVTLELHGNGRCTPSVTSLRAEYPSHDLLRRLPRLFSRKVEDADFLRRYLAIFEGALGDLDARAFARRVLLDARAAPPEILPWLAGFLGLVLDERCSEEARRRLIGNASRLFRFRGTVSGLQDFIEISLGLNRKVIIIEHYRVRGFGGAFVGEEGDLSSRAIVGAGYRVGGAVGELEEATVRGDGIPDDAYETHAHRFSVVIPAYLTKDQLGIAETVLEIHRPAHTIFELCTVQNAARVGMGLHVELSSLVGRSGGFTQLQVGGSLLGRDAILGRPGVGVRVGSSGVGYMTGEAERW